MRRILGYAGYALYGVAVILSLVLLGLWVAHPDLSKMALLLRYWHLALASIVAVTVGGICRVVADG